MTALSVGAPLRGWAMPLDQVPDPVFSERMMGDGIAIDPLEGLVVAPASARIAAAAATSHAVTLELANGAHLLIHVGLDTVALGGEGFELCVAQGDQVSAGAPLIRFDMDLVARRAKSLVTPIVLIDPAFRMVVPVVDRLVAIGETLFELAPETASFAAQQNAAGPSLERRLTLALPNGLHARPAARIVNLLKPRDARVEIAAGERSADARSMVALLALGLKQGSEVRLSATGPDAENAVAAVAALLQDPGHEASVEGHVASLVPGTTDRATILTGIQAAPGLAIGPAVRFRPTAIEIANDGRGAEVEMQALDEAIAAAAGRLRAAGDSGAGVAAAHLAIVEDPQLVESARADIAAGRSAGFAWQSATAAAADSIRATGNPLLIERIADLEDVAGQLHAQLAGDDHPIFSEIPAGAILVADDLLPSQFLAFGDRLAGIVTARGGATSHVAILAAAAGIPMLVAVGQAILSAPEGGEIVLDADAARVDLAPDGAALAAAGRRLAEATARCTAEAARAREDCRMADGTRIEIFANLASSADALRAVAAGAEGCGLLRTEFLFLDRAGPPGEEEQAEAYGAIAKALAGRPLIVRTLDIGADKQVPYLSLPREENPALGERGIRLALARPELLRTQLRAILRAVPAAQCRIMVPMVVERDELRMVRSILDAEAAALGRTERIQLGAMIETPASALMASSLAEEADFLSIGTNDLTQYALVCDRGNPATAGRVDALHPAVLHLIRSAADGARRHGRWLGVCGSLASDPAAAAILIGLGVRELSVAPARIAEIKEKVRQLRREDCADLAERALNCASAGEVRRLLADPPTALKGAA